MAIIFCPRCGSKISAGAKFCGTCGSPLQQTSNQPSQAYSPQATPTSTGGQVASATSAATTAATKSPLTWVIVAVVAVVAVGAGWFFFFNKTSQEHGSPKRVEQRSKPSLTREAREP